MNADEELLAALKDPVRAEFLSFSYKTDFVDIVSLKNEMMHDTWRLKYPPAMVFVAGLGERRYQTERWSECVTASAGLHTVTEFLVFMEDYISEAKHIVSRNAEPAASRRALHNIRKVYAMAQACMEQHGVPFRGEPENPPAPQSS